VKDVIGTGYDVFKNIVPYMPGENEEILKKTSCLS
jgi:hypothetical protein